MTPPPDPFDLSADLRSYADLLRDLIADPNAVACPEAREAVVLIANGLDTRADRCDAALGASAAAVQAAAVSGVLRLMSRSAPVPVVPRPAAEVIRFPGGGA